VIFFEIVIQNYCAKLISDSHKERSVIWWRDAYTAQW